MRTSKIYRFRFNRLTNFQWNQYILEVILCTVKNYKFILVHNSV